MASKFRWVFIAGLLALMTVCIALSWSTRDAMVHLPFLREHEDPLSGSASQNTIVNLQPWQTAEALTALAASAEETEYAREAEHLADHEVDQAFAAALRETTMQRHAFTGEAAALAQKVARLQKIVDDDQARVHELTAHDPDDDLDVAKAQLGLDTDQFTEAQQDLTRAGGDQRGRIQEELTAHEAAMRKYDAQVTSQSPPAINAAEARATFAANVNAWFEQRKRHELLEAAAQKSRADATVLTSQHDKLEHSQTASIEARDKASRLAILNSQSTRSQVLGIYDDRIETQRQLAETYNKWAAQVLLQRRMTGHLMLQSLALIAFILICVMVLDELAMRLAGRPALDQRRMGTLSTMLKLAIEFTGAVLILLVMFGKPSQLPTILGLTTAGLTVALQDFIIAFFGWFVLMGRNGIRIGDWVEINGVVGEIVKIGLFRTSMLEMGNSVDKGRPTGRRTAFINSFAIKGQYFNFSTTGQWMWDEIRVSIPAERDAYKTIEQVRAQVMEETAKDAQQAEQEWKRVSRHFATEPAVDMRPGASGIDIVVRYVTRAGNRFEVRNRLYQKVLGLLHRPAEN
jgi:small-conductance mechanosensitive channel